ncbi:MAG: squalene/phytoene synthase family protein [Gammaproteobacteria bacterium]|jgi:phytoene synthase|nr:squalene/phytoene synthase family protein [Gammaproteobacteria bacterium]
MTSSHLKAKSTPRGSSFYYLKVFSPQVHHHALNIVCAFYQEMKVIVENVTEPQVAKAKLTWWTQEISRLFAHQPQHPLSQSLLPIVQQYHLNEQDFQQIIAQMIHDVDHHHFTHHDELIQYCENSGGILCGLMCHILSFGNTITKNFTQYLGVAMQLILLIRNFGKDISHGKMYLPLQEEIYHPSINQEKLSLALSEYAQMARHAYKTAIASLNKYNHRSVLGIVVLANIYMTLLDEMERDNFHVLKQKYCLTPIRKYWIGWRTRFL